MKIGLRYREQLLKLSTYLLEELESIVSALQAQQDVQPTASPRFSRVSLAPSPVTTTSAIYVENTDVNAEFITRSAANSPGLTFRRSRGSSATPQKVLSGDRLGQWSVDGWKDDGTTTPSWADAGQVAVFAEEDYNTTCGSSLRFATVLTGATARAVRWRVNGSGHWAPEVDDTYDVGTSSLRVRTVYVDTAVDLDAANVVTDTTTGTKIGTATGQKLGFWGATPVVQQVLATGAGATVDNVISLLQTLGLCKQS